jgi:hypothetical protein
MTITAGTTYTTKHGTFLVVSLAPEPSCTVDVQNVDTKHVARYALSDFEGWIKHA